MCSGVLTNYSGVDSNYYGVVKVLRSCYNYYVVVNSFTDKLPYIHFDPGRNFMVNSAII